MDLIVYLVSEASSKSQRLACNPKTLVGRQLEIVQISAIVSMMVNIGLVSFKGVQVDPC